MGNPLREQTEKVTEKALLEGPGKSNIRGSKVVTQNRSSKNGKRGIQLKAVG